MSYSIDFHFGNVATNPEIALERVDGVLCQSGFAFLDYCHELEVDEDGEVDTVFPAVTVVTLKEGAAIGKDWIGRSHYYRWKTLFDLGVYAWRKSTNALVLSIANNEWKCASKIPPLLDKITNFVCSVSEAVGSPFGLSMVNSDYFPLGETAFREALELLKKDAAEPELLWATDKYFPYNDFLAAAGSRRTVIRPFSSYSLALRVDRDSEGTTSYAKPKTLAGSPDRAGVAT